MTTGSDFAPENFSPVENRDFANLLVQLRVFENTIASEFRKLDSKVDALAESMKKTKSNLAETKGSLTKIRDSLKRLERRIRKTVQNSELPSGIEEEEGEDENENSIVADEEVEVDDQAEEPEGAENETTNENAEDDTMEIMMNDPFLGNGFCVGTFDGNPSTPFSQWVEKFKDVLSLITTNLTEPQKIARLRFCLAGQARDSLDELDPAPTTLAAAIDHLKIKYHNGSTKILARQALSMLKQAPGESVFAFASRLSSAVKSALMGEANDTIDRRLLDEFLDRLNPDLQYEVKSERPTTYTAAYELAQHYEMLKATRRPFAGISVSELAEKVDALTVQNSRQQFQPPPNAQFRQQPNSEYRQQRDGVVCYYCQNPGHIRRNCQRRARDMNSQNFGANSNRRDHYNQDYIRRKNLSRDREYERNRDRDSHEYNRYRGREAYGFGAASRSQSRERGHGSRRLPPAEIAVAGVTKCSNSLRIKARINGTELNCLVDTGAHCSLISIQTAKRIGLNELFPSSFSGVVGLGQNVIPTLGQKEVELELAGCKAATNINVIGGVIGKDGSCDAIIGRETLCKLPLMLDFQTWALIKVKSENEFLPTQLNAEKLDNPRRVRSKPNRGCFYCNDMSHRIRNCRRRMRDESAVNF